MTNLACVATGTSEQATTRDDARAEAGAAGEENQIGGSASRAPAPLGKRSGIGVVDERDRTLEVGFKPRNQLRTFPARKVRRGENAATRGIKRTAACDADAAEIATKSTRRSGNLASCLSRSAGGKLRAGNHLTR